VCEEMLGCTEAVAVVSAGYIERIWAGYRLKVHQFQELTDRLSRLSPAVAHAGVQVGSWPEQRAKMEALESQVAFLRAQKAVLEQRLQKEEARRKAELRGAEEELEAAKAEMFELRHEVRRRSKAADTSILGDQRQLAQERAATRWRLDPRIPSDTAILLKQRADQQKAAALREQAAKAQATPTALCPGPASPDVSPDKENVAAPKAPRKRVALGAGERLRCC